MRSNDISSPKLFLLTAALSVWLLFSAFAAFWSDPSTSILALALLAFTTTMALTMLFRFSGWLAAVFSIIIFSFTILSLNGFTRLVFVPIGIHILSIVISALLGSAIAKEVSRVNHQLANDQKLIKELRLYDPDTGLLRYQYVLRTLKTEIIRSQRYEKNLSVILVQIGNLAEIESEHGPAGIEIINRQVAELLSVSLRAIDIPFGGEKMGAILPETSPEGTQIVVKRLVNSASRKARAALYIGAAHFPADGVTENELIQSAESALQVSQSTGQPYVEYSNLREAAGYKGPDNSTKPES
jgi:diguanylate cyclase (GGDEF)-like protein